MIAELKVVPVPEKQLRDDEVCSLIDLVPQPIPVDMATLAARDVSFRKASDANREIALRNGLMAWIDPTLRLSNVKRVDRPTRSNGLNAGRS